MKNDASVNLLIIYFPKIYPQKSNILNINMHVYKKNNYYKQVLLYK